MNRNAESFICCVLAVSIFTQALAQEKSNEQPPTQPEAPLAVASQTPLATLQLPSDGLPAMISEFTADIRTVQDRFRVPLDSQIVELNRNLLNEWESRLAAVPFDSLTREHQVNYLLLRNEIAYRKTKLELEASRDEQAASLIPFLDDVRRICKLREDVQPLQADEIAEQYQKISRIAESESKKLRDKETTDQESAGRVDPMVAIRASNLIRRLRRSLEESHSFYKGYDPNYSWWAEQPFNEASKAMDEYAKTVYSSLAGLDESDRDKIVGQPIGEDGLAAELQYAMIPYTAAELVKIAEREFEWCEKEATRAANDLGLDGDWKRALEHVKNSHVDPGQQPTLIRELAWEAIHFLEAHDLLTVPPLAANGWRMDMMSPDAQKMNPYFLGGEKIIVSFPTNTMSHDEKLMSLRSNNIHFCRATVHHELIPGHHMQHYATVRYRPYRQLFDTPFWIEGWALYWEMLLWDLDFHQSAEDRVGMLFWRKHRCARIIFSLNYQLGKWTPEECIAYLSERVGHEPTAATAEVRRSIMGGYGPLYQAAYMLGGLQLRSLHKELVQSGEMTNRQFHDAVLQQNSIPIEMIRGAMTNVQLTPDYKSNWRFAGELE
jgi:Bacterial protein of unknown function (DUF885)